MWNLKFKVVNVDSIYTPLTKKYRVYDYFYPLDRFRHGKGINILGMHILEGEKAEQDKFARDLKKSRKTLKFERNENSIVALIKEEEKFYELLYNPELYFPAPVLIKEGCEYWNVACWDRKIIENLIKEIQKWKTKLVDFELQNIRQLNLKEIYFPRITPELPEKQKQAFDIAIANGYYTFPRKVDLGDLAKVMKVTTSTYQEHLRKAEAKLMPFFSGNVK